MAFSHHNLHTTEAHLRVTGLEPLRKLGRKEANKEGGGRAGGREGGRKERKKEKEVKMRLPALGSIY